VTAGVGACGKGEGLADCEMGEVGVDFCVVEDVAAERGSHVAFFDTLAIVRKISCLGQLMLTSEIHVRLGVNFKTSCFTRNGLEKSRTTRARRSKHKKQLALLHNTLKVAKNIDTSLLSRTQEINQRLDNIQWIVDNTLLVFSTGTPSENIQVSKGDTETARRCRASFGLVKLDKGLDPCSCIKVGRTGIKSCTGLRTKGVKFGADCSRSSGELSCKGLNLVVHNPRRTFV
jgi:hypothetical protein